MIEWKSREIPRLNPPREMPDLIWQILCARGIHSGDKVERFFSPKLKDLRDPLSMKGMREAVERLVRAFQNKERICIYADFDLDGTSGLALLKSGLEGLGFGDILGYQPKRLSEGYGVHASAIEEIAETCKIVVTVDVGITAFEAAERAKELGMELIVTDHHQPLERLPEALVIVNPNQKGCGSGLGHLSGAGVAFFLFLAVRRALREQGLGRDLDPKELLDCFVIGTLTDLVPVVDENRVLIKHGLLQLAKTKRPGLSYLLEELGLKGRPLSSQDVAIRFAPKINALSRMEKNIRPIDLFLLQDPKAAKDLVCEVMACNNERISLQASAEELAMKMHREKIAGDERPNFVWVFSDRFHRGVVGLVATKMAKALGVPAFIGSHDLGGSIVGSARLPDGSSLSLVEALEYCADLLVKFGGHNAAAGFELAAERTDEFEKKMKEFWTSSRETQKPAIYYDGKGRLPDISANFMSWYEEMGPFGSAFDTPVLLFPRMNITKIRKLRGGHFKLWIRQSGLSEEREALWFSPPPGHPLADEANLQSRQVELLAEPQWNYFAGRKTIQLLIHDIREIGSAHTPETAEE